MSITPIFRATAVAASLLILPAADAAAQIYETVGTRAQGMGGAFVAIADDATASWWNPAGLAAGAYFSLVIERGMATEPADAPAAGPAWESQAGGFSVAFPALGLSYYRLRISEIHPITAEPGAGRQDQGAEGIDLRSRAISEFGATLGQSVGNHLVIASTVKLVRTGAAAAVDVATGDPLDRAADLDVSLQTRGDLDVGAMVTAGVVRIGFSVKHVNEPGFGEGTDRFELARQARAGLALVGGGAGPLAGISASVDADLTRSATPFGDVRHVAAGAEAWLFERRIGLRGGVSGNTIGELRTATSAGLSLGSRSGFYLDGALTFGSDRSREGWSLGFRVSF